MIVDVSGEEAAADTSHIYTGEIFGKLLHHFNCQKRNNIFENAATDGYYFSFNV